MSHYKNKLKIFISKYPISKIFIGILKTIDYLFFSYEYRRLFFYRIIYGFKKRYEVTRLKLLGRNFITPDILSFLSMYEEIFVKKIYILPEEPKKILDLGSNIGVSILWFKENYPNAKIHAYEADPHIFNILKNNLKEIKNISVYNFAVWDSNTNLNFYNEGSDAGLVKEELKNSSQLIKAKNIKEILDTKGPFDFIKIDIEGAENKVLLACKDKLKKTKYIFCEYHSFQSQPQNLYKILYFFKQEGFRVHIQSSNESSNPFTKKVKISEFDMLLNIFAWREA